MGLSRRGALMGQRNAKGNNHFIYYHQMLIKSRLRRLAISDQTQNLSIRWVKHLSGQNACFL